MALPFDVDSTWVNPASKSLDAGELRRADGSIFAGDGSAIGARGGIVRHGDTSLSVSVSASDVVTIQPGPVVIPGNAVSGTGCYRSALAAAVTGNLTARDATNARIDIVVFRQLDTDVVGSHAAYTARVEVIAGTPSATPSAPALPSMAVELARITVPASGGGTASVDLSRRTYAAAVGAVMPVPTEARLPASAATWQKAVALDTGVEYTWDGAVWTGGWVTYTPTLVNFAGTVVRARYFATAKSVTVQVRVAATGSATGTITVGLPFPVASGYATGTAINNDMIGTACASQASSGSVVIGVVKPYGPASVLFRGGSNQEWKSVIPITWFTGDLLEFNATYERA